MRGDKLPSSLDGIEVAPENNFRRVCERYARAYEGCEGKRESGGSGEGAVVGVSSAGKEKRSEVGAKTSSHTVAGGLQRSKRTDPKLVSSN